MQMICFKQIFSTIHDIVEEPFGRLVRGSAGCHELSNSDIKLPVQVWSNQFTV